MKKLKVLTALCLIGILTFGSLAGCGSTKTNDSGDKITEVTWWAFPNFETIDGEVGKYEQEIIDDFQSKNPDIKVNLEMISFDNGAEKINAAIASKSAPDILYDAPGRIISYGRQGVLANVNDMVNKLNGDVSDQILSACKVDDQYYMYPFNTSAFTMAVNKTMFEEAGLLDYLPLNKENRLWTVEDYTKALEAIKKANPDVIPMGFYSKSTAGDQGTRAFLSNLYGGSILNKDLTEYTLDSPEMVKSMEWVKNGIANGLIVSGSEGLASSNSIDLFTQGKSAFTILYSPGLKNTYKDKKLDNFEDVLLPLPAPEGKNSLEFLIGGLCVFNNGDDAKIEASKKFIDFLCNDTNWQTKNLKSTGTFSVRKSITGLYDDEQMKLVEGYSKYYCTYYNTVVGFDKMRTFWFPALQEMTLGQTPVEDALKKLNENANATLNQK